MFNRNPIKVYKNKNYLNYINIAITEKGKIPTITFSYQQRSFEGT